jgi:membrane-associated phospholipid phosphatase
VQLFLSKINYFSIGQVMKSRIFSLIVSLWLVYSPNASAVSDKTWADISDVGVATLIGGALILPITKDDWEGSRQAAYSMGTATGIAQLGKAVIHAERPDQSDNNSFPSGHTSVAFASATTLYKRYGWEIGLPAYGLATLTGSARVGANKHYWRDVLVGAAIGIGSGWYFTDAFDNKVQLIPWADSKGAGIEATMAW